MAMKRYIAAVFLVVVIGIVVQVSGYSDTEDDTSENLSKGIRELYYMLMQRDLLDNERIAGFPFQHLMVRKSMRSPSLRLRFGRRSESPELSWENGITNFEQNQKWWEPDVGGAGMECPICSFYTATYTVKKQFPGMEKIVLEHFQLNDHIC